MQVYEVSQVNEYLRQRFEEDEFLSGVFIRGEISNYKLYPSGHHYFTLKDASSAMRCVMFRGNAFRLRFRPENGMKVIAFGRISVFPRDGAYQLYCTEMTPDGVGDLHVAFEQLKAKLQAEGLFAQDRKKPLPRFPHRIAIITSAAGAALHDMLRILRKRYPLTEVVLLAVRVQGAEAPLEIAAALRYANRYRVADLVITGEGRLDRQTTMGKAPGGVLARARKQNIPVVAIAGAVEAADELLAQGFAAVFPIQAAPTSLPEAMETARAAENIRRTVKQIVNLLKSFGQ